MKKMMTIIAALLLIVGCKGNTKEEQNMQANSNKQKKFLVAYFSYSGTTKHYAEKIAKMADADIFRIEAAQPYTEEDVDWSNPKARVNVEMKDNPNSRPGIARNVDKMENYDVVFLGFPIWWYIAPNIINTFLETHNLKGKTIIPFFTSAESGPGETDKHLRKSINYEVTWKPAVRVKGMDDKQLQEWVEKNLQ